MVYKIQLASQNKDVHGVLKNKVLHAVTLQLQLDPSTTLYLFRSIQILCVFEITTRVLTEAYVYRKSTTTCVDFTQLIKFYKHGFKEWDYLLNRKSEKTCSYRGFTLHKAMFNNNNLRTT